MMFRLVRYKQTLVLNLRTEEKGMESDFDHVANELLRAVSTAEPSLHNLGGRARRCHESSQLCRRNSQKVLSGITFC